MQFLSSLIFIFLIGIASGLNKGRINNGKPTQQSAVNKCDSITAYYIGHFKSKWIESSQFKAQFEVKMKIDHANKRIWMTSQNVNNSYSQGKSIFTSFYAGEWSVGTDSMKKEEWSVPFVNFPGLQIHVQGTNSTKNSKTGMWNPDGLVDIFVVTTFPEFNNSFVLNQPVGSCTNKQIINPAIPAKDGLFEYCVCCGDYQEGGPLKCPKNPWLHGPKTENPSKSSPKKGSNKKLPGKFKKLSD